MDERVTPTPPPTKEEKLEGKSRGGVSNLHIGFEGFFVGLTGVFAVASTLFTSLFVPVDLVTYLYYWTYGALTFYFAYKYKLFYKEVASTTDIRHAKLAAYGIIVFLVLEVMSIGEGGSLIAVVVGALSLFSAFRKFRISSKGGDPKKVGSKLVILLASVISFLFYAFLVLVQSASPEGMIDPWMTFGYLLGGMMRPLVLLPTFLLYYMLTVKKNVFTADLNNISARSFIKMLKDVRFFAIWSISTLVSEIMGIWSSY